MIRFIRKYWVELLIFGVVFGVFLADLSPNMTWINTNSDGVHLVFASHYMYVAHKTSLPLYLLLGRLFLFIPFGTEYWRMGLMSVLSSLGTAIFIYLSIKALLPAPMADKYKRMYGLLGVLIWGASALVISQTAITEDYPLVTMLGIAAYYFSLKEKWVLCSMMLGAGIAIHLLGGIPLLLILLFRKEMRNMVFYGIILSFLLFYLYIPIVVIFNHAPDMWGNTTISSFLADTGGTTSMLLGGLSIWDVPKRLLDSIGLIGLSFGLGIIPLIWYIAKQKRFWRGLLFWLCITPVIFFVTNLAVQTFVYLLPTVAFGAIIVGIALSKMKPYWLYAVGVVGIILLAFNANYFDIGRTLDKNLSATEFYTQELPKIPDGEILLAQNGWEWAMIFPYNKNEGRNIIPIDIETLVSPVYESQLKAQGIQFEDNLDKNRAIRQAFIATSIVKLNDNVWTTRPTDPLTYGAEVIKGKDHLDILNKVPPEPAQWHWKPSNPYDVLTGAIEIDQWGFVTYSNKNVRLVFLVFAFALSAQYLFWKVWDARKKMREGVWKE